MLAIISKLIMTAIAIIFVFMVLLILCELVAIHEIFDVLIHMLRESNDNEEDDLR